MLKSICKSVNELKAAGIDDPSVAGSHDGTKLKTKIGRRLSKSAQLEATATYPSVINSIDSSVDLPDLQRMALSKRDLPDSLGFSNSRSAFVESFAW